MSPGFIDTHVHLTMDASNLAQQTLESAVHVACLLGAAKLPADGTDTVSRETPPTETAVLTVGSIQAGTKSNIIPDQAVLQLNVRTYSEQTRNAVLDVIGRIVIAGCQVSGSPKDPELELFDRFPLTDNDGPTTEPVARSFTAFFGDRAQPMGQQTASEDFSDVPNVLGTPYTYWASAASTPTPIARPRKPAEWPKTSRSTIRRTSPPSSSPPLMPALRRWWWPR